MVESSADCRVVSDIPTPTDTGTVAAAAEVVVKRPADAAVAMVDRHTATKIAVAAMNIGVSSREVKRVAAHLFLNWMEQ